MTLKLTISKATRRHFLRNIAVVAGTTTLGAGLVACGSAPTATPVPPTAPPAPPAGFDKIGTTATYKPDADPTEFKVGDKIGFVFNKGGEFQVYSNVCTHAGCEVLFEKAQGKHICPCHKSEYDKSGEILKGPALQRLPKFEFKVVGDTLYAKVSG
jgi:Rieske Fe-S protein